MVKVIINSNKKLCNRFQSLDLIRGVAAFAIAIFHSGLAKGFVSENAWVAVDLFFILSGFVLAYRYFNCERFDFHVFLSHRLARLYPLHFFTLLLLYIWYCFVGFPSMTDGTSIGLLQNLLLLQSVGFNQSGATWNMPSWSVSVEFWVNIFFVLFLIKQKTINQIILVWFGYMLILRHSGALGVSVDNYFGFLNDGLVRGMAGFLLGVVTFRLYKTIRAPGFLMASFYEVVICSLLFFYFWQLDKNKILYETFLFIPLFFLLILVFSFQRGLLSYLTILFRLDVLGIISYSIYLIHTPLLVIMGYMKVLNIYSFIAGLLISSVIAYRFIEKPTYAVLRDKLQYQNFNGSVIIFFILALVLVGFTF